METEVTIKEFLPEEAVQELLNNGTVTLTATTREEIYDHAQQLVDSLPQGTKWKRTIVQYHPDTFDYEQTFTLINKK